MKKKLLLIVINLFIVFNFISCSKNKMIEKKLRTEYADMITIRYKAPNNYYSWFYCDEDIDQLQQFIKEYGCTDVNEWNFTDTTEKKKFSLTFLPDLNNSILDNKEKELKTGFYIRIYYKLFNKDLYPEFCEIYYVQFNRVVTTKTLDFLNSDNFISSEYWSGNHKLEKSL